MSDAPIYRFNRNPRFSVNHLTRYLSTTNAGQRDKIVQEAKFPRTIPVTIYGEARRAIQAFLGSGRDLAYFDVPLRKLERTANADPEKRDEALRCIRALRAFMDTYAAKRWANATFSPNAVDVPLKVSGVFINVRLDCQIYERRGDETVTGGMVLFYAQTPESRKNIELRRRQVASTIFWALEGGQLEAMPRLCFSFDVFGEEIVRAPDAKDRFRSDVENSCREVCLKWHTIEPPAGYDGPDWH